jgi:hypothetical protein
MEKIDLSAYSANCGKNNGDKREFAMCAYYGIERTKHDSSPYHSHSDIELDGKNISVKTSGASLMSGALSEGCKTFEGIWRRYRRNTHSDTFAYVTIDFMAYLMNIQEFSKFIHQFGYIDRESSQNGGQKKIKLRNESKKMLGWLEMRAAA